MRHFFSSAMIACLGWTLLTGTTYQVKENQRYVGFMKVHDGHQTTQKIDIIKNTRKLPGDISLRQYRDLLETNLNKASEDQANKSRLKDIYKGMTRTQAEKNLVETTANLRFKKYTETVSLPLYSTADGSVRVNAVVYDYRYATPSAFHCEKVYFYNNEVLKTTHEIDPR